MTIPFRLGIAALVALLCASVLQASETYRLGVAPVLDYQDTLRTYQPLVDYLSRETGARIELAPARNFIEYWSQMRKPDAYDLVLDGAHLAAYRLENMDHQLLAKVSGVLSFSLISRPDELIFEAGELSNRRVAVQASPNLGGLLIFQLFDNPMRQPIMIEVKNAMDALDAVREKRADAAYVPTPILSHYPEANVIVSSGQMPNMSITASPNVPPELRLALAQALLTLSNESRGESILKGLNIEGFEAAENSEYQGLASLLNGMWGY